MAILEAKWLALMHVGPLPIVSHKRTYTHTHTGEILTYRSEHCKLFPQPQDVVLYACRIFHLNKAVDPKKLRVKAKISL
jgi:hypothetical protein